MTWDTRGSGSREYKPEQYERIVQVMRDHHTGRKAKTTYESISHATGIYGRTLRQIMADADGREFVLATGDEGVWVAESYDEARGGTGRFFSQARRMRERAERREEYAQANLPRIQGSLL